MHIAPAYFIVFQDVLCCASRVPAVLDGLIGATASNARALFVKELRALLPTEITLHSESIGVGLLAVIVDSCAGGDAVGDITAASSIASFCEPCSGDAVTKRRSSG
jgi:hypothetical protein